MSISFEIISNSSEWFWRCDYFWPWIILCCHIYCAQNKDTDKIGINPMDFSLETCTCLQVLLAKNKVCNNTCCCALIEESKVKVSVSPLQEMFVDWLQKFLKIYPTCFFEVLFHCCCTHLLLSQHLHFFHFPLFIFTSNL